VQEQAPGAGAGASYQYRRKLPEQKQAQASKDAAQARSLALYPWSASGSQIWAANFRNEPRDESRDVIYIENY